MTWANPTIYSKYLALNFSSKTQAADLISACCKLKLITKLKNCVILIRFLQEKKPKNEF